MPDLKDFSVVRSGTATLTNAPKWTISFQVCDSTTGAVLRDFTGANAFTFPQVFASFSTADQDDIVAQICMLLIRKKAPDLFP